ncbi:hypothetical protein TNCT_342331 [Trichonephila clavata]|uniref:Uncharacterized protein n=1 Tax=Trichonephila clavata TaxID=2740835 RepID=A0A8X6HPG1_TRICU|nr:hypothetical protein TNCT_342331 [Trichonephila clavata]
MQTLDSSKQQNVWDHLDYRLEVCRVAKKTHIEGTLLRICDCKYRFAFHQDLSSNPISSRGSLNLQSSNRVPGVIPLDAFPPPPPHVSYWQTGPKRTSPRVVAPGLRQEEKCIKLIHHSPDTVGFTLYRFPNHCVVA